MEDTTLQEPASRISWKHSFLLLMGILALLAFAFLLSGSSLRPRLRPEPQVFIRAMDVATQGYIGDNGPFPKNLDNHTFWEEMSGADSGRVYMSFKMNQINDNVEVIDHWGTPLRIWYVSDMKVGITSAGPDKTFGTADDISNLEM